MYKLNKNSHIHFVGICGIGMSGLAQMLKSQGFIITGSDRAIEADENSAICATLRNQNIILFPQNGAFLKYGIPEILIYSSAIEDDNPDFTNKKIPLVHRSKALQFALDNCPNKQKIAITGSSGKTTVTSWLAETLELCGQNPSFYSGGLVNRFRTANCAGNFHSGSGKYFVFEADESDKSLITYSPDYAIILNIGTDHYPTNELIVMFKQFLKKVLIGVVVEKKVYELLGEDSFSHLKVHIFSATENDTSLEFSFKEYAVNNSQTTISHKGKTVLLPAPGLHTATNAMAVLATLDMLDLTSENQINNLAKFKGVWRRFDYAGDFMNSVKVFDDYAHNVEKIICCLKTARNFSPNKIIFIFQPHGYAPLKFMQDELFKQLEKELRHYDLFIFLPVYYAGGTTSFSPTSEEVVANYAKKGKKIYKYCTSRKNAKSLLDKVVNENDLIVISGARDNSLSNWAKKISKKLE